MVPLTGMGDAGRRRYRAVICLFAPCLSTAVLGAGAAPATRLSDWLANSPRQGQPWKALSGAWRVGGRSKTGQLSLGPSSLLGHLQLGL